MSAIYHTGDWHLRDATADLFKSAIDKFIDYVKNDEAKTKIITIPGDIFHNKTKLTPTDIENFCYAITQLSPICDTIISIPGNHDKNLYRPDSTDLIFPLHKNLKIKNYFHYAKSGSYIHNGLVFNVQDPSDPVLLPIENEEKTNILLMHENVDGVLFGGYPLKGRFGIKDLEKYDIVMAGHIHEVSKIGDNGYYSGALFQQNQAESYTKGFIRWFFPNQIDLEDNQPTAEFIPIENPNAILYIRINNDKSTINGIQAYANKDIMPTKPHRVIIEANTPDQKIFDTTYQNIIKTYNITPEIRTNDTYSVNTANLSNLDDQLVLLEKALKAKQTQQPIIDKILEIHRSHPREAPVQKNKITLVSLEWMNLFCYADQNIINFTDLNDVISGIIAPNKSGKSAVVDILVLALYGKTLRGTIKHIINKKQKTAMLRVVFKVNDDLCKLTRSFNDVWRNNIEFLVNGINKTDESVTAVYNHVESLIGKYEDFISSVVLTQDRQGDYVYMSPIQQAQYLSRLLNLDVLEDDLKYIHVEKVKAKLLLKPTPKKTREILIEEQKTVNKNVEEITKETAELTQYIESNKDNIPIRPSMESNVLINEIGKLETRFSNLSAEIARNDHDDLKMTQEQLEAQIKEEPPKPTGLDRKISQMPVTKISLPSSTDGTNPAQIMQQLEKRKIDMQIALGSETTATIAAKLAKHKQRSSLDGTHIKSLENIDYDAISAIQDKLHDELCNANSSYDSQYEPLYKIYQSIDNEKAEQDIKTHAEISCCQKQQVVFETITYGEKWRDMTIPDMQKLLSNYENMDKHYTGLNAKKSQYKPELQQYHQYLALDKEKLEIYVRNTQKIKALEQSMYHDIPQISNIPTTTTAEINKKLLEIERTSSELSDLRSQLKSEYMPYHKFWPILKDQAVKSLRIMQCIDNLDRSLFEVKSDKADILRKLTPLGSSEQIQKQIDRTCEALRYTVDDGYLRRFKFNQSCQCCTINSAIIKSIAKLNNETNTPLPQLNANKKAALLLEDELNKLIHNENTIKQINDLKSQLTKTAADSNIDNIVALQYIVNNYDGIKENIAIFNQINESANVSSNMSEFYKLRATCELYEQAADKYEHNQKIQDEIADLIKNTPDLKILFPKNLEIDLETANQILVNWEQIKANKVLLDEITALESQIEKPNYAEKEALRAIIENAVKLEHNRKTEAEEAKLKSQINYPEITLDKLSIILKNNQKIKQNHQLYIKIQALNKQLKDAQARKSALEYQKYSRLSKIAQELENINTQLKYAQFLVSRQICNIYDEYIKKRDIVQAKLQRISINAKLELYKKKLANVKAEEAEYERIMAIYKTVDDARAKLSNNQTKIAILHKQLREITDDLQTYMDNAKLQLDIDVYETYEKCLNCKTGLPMQILNDASIAIMANVNAILGHMADFKIGIKLETTKMNIYIMDKDKEIPLDLGSGFQKFVISFALRYTFIKMSNKSLPEFIIIDEGFGCLDEENLLKVIEMMPKFKQIYRFIVIITHLDIVKNCIENALFVNTQYKKMIEGKSYTFSQIKYGETDLVEAKIIYRPMEKYKTLPDEKRLELAMVEQRSKVIGGENQDAVQQPDAVQHQDGKQQPEKIKRERKRRTPPKPKINIKKSDIIKKEGDNFICTICSYKAAKVGFMEKHIKSKKHTATLEKYEISN